MQGIVGEGVLQRLVVLVLLFWGSKVHGSRDFASVEPYVASWCAKQFPEELPTFNGYRMASLRESHVEIEPFLAEWCLAQFPDDLAQKSLDDRQYYVPVEDTLAHWAARSLAVISSTDPGKEPPMVDLVPYIGEWCLSQFPEELGALKHGMFGELASNHAPLQPVLAEWCMEQFPQEIDPRAFMKGLNYSLTFEAELIQWGLSATEKSENDCTSFDTKKDLSIIFLSISLTLSFATILYLLGRGQGCQQTGKEYDTERTEILGDSSSESSNSGEPFS